MTRLGAGACLLLVALAVPACQSRVPVSDGDLDALSAVLRQRIETAYAVPFRSGRVQEWSQVFATDALAYHDGPPPFKGRDAIVAFGTLVHQNFEIRQFDVTVDEVRSQGDWAITGGHYSANFVPRNASAYAGASGARQGKFLFVWERQSGQWRIIADMGNSTDLPPTAP
jgi:hypothetical protein